MNKRNFLFIFSLVFSFFYIVKCAEPVTNKCKFEYFYINNNQISAKETDFELKKDTGIAEIKEFLKKCNYNFPSDENKYNNIDNTMTCRVLLITNIDTGVENYDFVDIIKNGKVDLSSKKCNSVRFYFFSNDVMTKIEKCKVKNVNIFGQNITLTNPIEIKDYLHSIVFPSSLGNSIYETLKTKNLTNNITLSEKQYGENKTITIDELLKNSYKDNYDNFYVKNGKETYQFTKEESENLCLDLSSIKFKRNITVNFKIPENYILDAECSNSFKLDLYLNDFSIKNIIITLKDSLKKYFNNLIYECRKKDPNFRATCDIEFLNYEFNAIDEPIDPKIYTLKNTTNTLEITKNEDISETNIFNLTDNSTIDIEVGENCELLKTMFAEITFNPLEGTEVNSKITKNSYKILLNLKDSSDENIKKQIVDYLKSKKLEGLYIPEDFYEQILNSDGFYKKRTHDHFELNINFNEKAKGSFLKPVGTPDPDLEYFKNYKEEDGKPIDPPQYIPPQPPVQQEQNDTPKLDKNTGNCAICCGKCLKCSNCKK